MSVVLVSLTLGVVILLYLYLTRNSKYWQKRGIPCADGALPGFGHTLQLYSTKTFAHLVDKFYKDNKDHSMVGFYNFTTPMLIVREPELVKTVMQTKFTSFHENGMKINPDRDPLLANHPFFTYGEKWITGRKRLTYAFSSMRLKILLESVKQVCVKFENFLDRKLTKDNKYEVELKDLFARFTAQVVSIAGFGVDGLCFEDGEPPESFHQIGKSFLEPGLMYNIIVTLIFFMPALDKIFRVSFLPKKIDRFFRGVVADVMERRKNDKTPKNDFLQLMSELEQTEGNEFGLDILASHATIFFVDAYDNASTILSFVGYQLATHPEVQEKLRDEVKTVLAKYDGAITYEALKHMTYMEQVIFESMRIIAGAGILIKVCTETCELKGSDGLVCNVEPGTNIIIPIYGLQEDSRYWKNPEVYDPERFNSDRKQSIVKFAFLPFGEGPRSCVGMRMAMIKMKACLTVLLNKYKLELSPKTKVPLDLTGSSFLTTAVGGLWAFIGPL